jgi:hypothetical protein
LVIIVLAFAVLMARPGVSLAHDPKKKNTKPTKASSAIKKAREKLDSAKAKTTAAGKYKCCVKPVVRYVRSQRWRV